MNKKTGEVILANTSLAYSLADSHETRDPSNICRDLGLHIHYHPLIDCRGYYIKLLGHTYITIADDLPEHVASFVCAHELGHHLLHSSQNRIFMDYRTYAIPGRLENEADQFAAQLLWGSPPMYEEQYLRDREMAECLNVPMCGLNARLWELGIYY